MKVGRVALAAVVPAIFFGGIALSAALNMWKTTSTKEPARFVSGQFAGEANPADIRGSYTFGDIQKAFGVPAESLARAFGIPSGREPAAFAVKELEELTTSLPPGAEIGTDSVRLFVALYRGLPYDPEPDTYLPAAAADILRQRGGLAAEQEAWLVAHTVPSTPVAAAAPSAAAAAEAPAPASTPTPEPAVAQAPAATAPQAPAPATAQTPPAAASEDRTIKGKTTFGELMQWGLTREQIEQVLGGPMGPPGTSVRDYLSAKGMEFSAYRASLQELVDQLAR